MTFCIALCLSDAMAIKGDCKITLEEVEEKKESKGKGALAAVSDSSLLLFPRFYFEEGKFCTKLKFAKKSFAIFTFFWVDEFCPRLRGW